MIDPHVHLRDWGQQDRETLQHGISCAAAAGIDALFEMPNTDPVLTSAELIEKRIFDAREAVERAGVRMHYGLYAGLTSDPEQRARMIETHSRLFPAVIGFKLFAGHSTGHMGITEESAQLGIYQQLTAADYRGLLAVHCEKESLLHPELYDPADPVSHTHARAASAEIASVRDQLRFAGLSAFRGTLHICHVSLPESVLLIEEARASGVLQCRVTCGVTPHHALLDIRDHEYAGNLVKMNPPLRSVEARSKLFELLLQGRIDWIESDHAPHSLRQKQEGASGIPGFVGYAYLVKVLEAHGLPADRIARLTGDRFCEVLGVEIPHSGSCGMVPEADHPSDPWPLVISHRERLSRT